MVYLELLTLSSFRIGGLQRVRERNGARNHEEGQYFPSSQKKMRLRAEDASREWEGGWPVELMELRNYGIASLDVLQAVVCKNYPNVTAFESRGLTYTKLRQDNTRHKLQCFQTPLEMRLKMLVSPCA